MIVSGEEEEEEEISTPIKPIVPSVSSVVVDIQKPTVPIESNLDVDKHEYQTLIKPKSESIDETELNDNEIKSHSNITLHNRTLSELMLHSITSIFHHDKLLDTINENSEAINNSSSNTKPTEIKKEPIKKEFNSDRLIQLRKANYELQSNLTNYLSNFYKGYNVIVSNLLKSFENSLQSAQVFHYFVLYFIQDASANLRSINSDLITLVTSMQETSLYKKK